jgi:hypothetical protein
LKGKETADRDVHGAVCYVPFAPTAKPAFGFVWTVDRDIVDQESDHLSLAANITPMTKHTKAVLNVAKFSVTPFA